VKRISEQLGMTLAVIISKLLPVTANIFPRSPILFTLIMEALRSSETPVHTIATRRYIPEYGSIHIISVKTSNPAGIMKC
jgi:hypothetical protein